MALKTIDIVDWLTTPIPCKGFKMMELNFSVLSYDLCRVLYALIKFSLHQ